MSRPIKQIREPVIAPLRNGSVVIGPTTGREFLSEANDVFSKLFGIRVGKEKPTEAKKRTKATLVTVYEVLQDSLAMNALAFLAEEENELFLTEGQIIWFCKHHRRKLRKMGGSTYFLFQASNIGYVAEVRFNEIRQLECTKFPILDGRWIFYGDRRHRIIAPD